MTDKKDWAQAGSRMTRLFCVGFNLTGIDNGNLDYSIAASRVKDLSDEQFNEFKGLVSRAMGAMQRTRKGTCADCVHFGLLFTNDSEAGYCYQLEADWNASSTACDAKEVKNES